ncbi:MAG: patatin-like phospholipase family protein [Tetragenococcus koreensis]|nr:patatin-like phospholipase family protein [Tetragenococcus koreensis]
MKFKKLYVSMLNKKPALLHNTKLIFPFYATHSAAKKDMAQAVYEEHCWYTVVQKQLIFFNVKLEDRQIKVTNILCGPLEHTSWNTILQAIDVLARSRFVQTVTLSFSAKETILTELISQGYQQDQEGLTKKLYYHTALVLSGGGARGAYQIGAWRALKELGITFELIAATSVGALNAALMMMNDEKKAQQLWYQISTEQILAFPKAAADNHSFHQLVRQLRSLSISALKEQGISARPLQELLRHTLDAKKWAEFPAQLFICTTRLRGLKEKVVAVGPVKQSWEWLVASAAFFPAMQPIQIKGEDYIDGGYRNDFPMDVALSHGATECICMDAKGPGIRKKTTVPEDVANLTLRSPWSLGSFLIFDSKRSTINEQLGYLETMKYFHHYTGFWYTFTNETNWQTDWQLFISKLPDHEYAWLQERSFWHKFYKLYAKKVPLEQVGMAFVELMGRFLSLLPDKVYTKDQFVTALTTAREKTYPPVEAALSFTEWVEVYHKEYFLLSKKNQFVTINELLEKETEIPSWFVEKSAVLFITVKFFRFLQKKEPKNA